VKETAMSLNRRGGRIDFTSSIDSVDEASQASFPASDDPAWRLPDDRRDEPQKDWNMSKKPLIGKTPQKPSAAPRPVPPPVESTKAPPTEQKARQLEPAPEQVALLAYELWESRGRPQGTDLEDWFQAERRLHCVS